MDFTGKKLFLAPLAGISDTVFRRMCKEHGADVVVSEMVSAEGLHYGSAATAALLHFDKTERPFGVQLFGARPDHLGRAAEYVQKTVAPDFIDLNAGCPVPKVVRKNGGASLLRDIRLFSDIVGALVKSVSVPVTVKIRSGWEMHSWVDVEFALAAQACGAAAVILHPRSKTMGFSGHSYWERIAIVKKALTVPLIGNGDILSEQDAARMFDTTGCDSIMIGRGALGNPWIFSRIKDLLAGRPVRVPDESERVQTACEHLRLHKELYGEKKTVAEMKKQASWYMKGLPQAASMRTAIFGARTSAEIEAALLRLLPEK
jgi:nifR3 family TIM-barrel protein